MSGQGGQGGGGCGVILVVIFLVVFLFRGLIMGCDELAGTCDSPWVPNGPTKSDRQNVLDDEWAAKYQVYLDCIAAFRADGGHPPFRYCEAPEHEQAGQ